MVKVPCCALAVMERLRFCEPVPHDLVHVDQAENAEVAQCTAQVCALQLRVSSRYGQT